MAAQELELMGVELDRLRFAAETVDDGGQYAFGAQPSDGLALRFARPGGQRGATHGPQARTGGRCTIAAMAASILIVEDEDAVARGIQYALQQEGYQVSVARNGEEGLDFATHHAPDLIILDVRLPGMDGFEMLRRLRGAGA